MADSKRFGALHRLFAGLAEQTFGSRLGLADPQLIDYLVELMLRFIHRDAIYSVRNLSGRRLEEVAEMLAEAQVRQGDARREIHRHIGDFTLFWSGVFPEALRRMQRSDRKDHLVEYCQQGKRAYYIASTIPDPENEAQTKVFERLSYEFELCAYGLGEVRREWERRDDEGDTPLLIN